MQRSSLIRIAFALASLGAIACTDEGIGDPCIPETIPCNADGTGCGYKASESYIEASSVQCRSRLCLVYKLDNGTQGDIPSDPRVLCTGNAAKDKAGCLTDDQLLKSVYCTCRCDSGGVKTKQELCSCDSGFTCETILNLGGPGIVGKYCVRSSTVNN
ncbi:MAG: hypothetical protein JWN48_5775 [Myxococcaceae bacterium]|nr:hypothetical protein [Myxococcaceae bacterium]